MLADRHLAVVGLVVDHRYRNAPEVQKVLTDHGEMIRCRTGISQQGGDDGLITLSVEADSSAIQDLESKLTRIEGVSVKSMVF